MVISLALVAITDVTLFFAFPGKPYFITAGAILPKLYANTILAVLNARFQIVGGRGYSDSMAMDFISFPSYVQNTRIDGRASIQFGQAAVVSSHREVFSNRELNDLVKMTDTRVRFPTH
jgi:hypothetical protein